MQTMILTTIVVAIFLIIHVGIWWVGVKRYDRKLVLNQVGLLRSDRRRFSDRMCTGTEYWIILLLICIFATLTLNYFH